MHAIITRLRQPSTYAGVATLLAVFGYNVAPELWNSITQFLVGASSIAAIVLNERRG
jgi:hypothetical protein